MKKTYLQKGFTLIELLVVIAIIGILSSVVLASLSTARNKGKATAVKSGLASFRSQMELKANESNYGTGTVGLGDANCDLAGTNYVIDTSLVNILANIRGNLATPATDIYCSTDATSAATKWAVAVRLPDQSNIYCVDNSGNVKLNTYVAIDNLLINNGVCL